jgi:hypothetical protein
MNGRDEGIDGEYVKSANGDRRVYNNRASHKPHAVIADGAAMQRVPGSLRFLTRSCREADVPLFIINDPRVWGGNTHAGLEEAVRDMRSTIKARIVRNALLIKEGSLFERGRLLGKLETETKWQIKDATRRSKEALILARQQLKTDQENDWSHLSAEDLKQQLQDHKVLVMEEPPTNLNSLDENQHPQPQIKQCRTELIQLCHECIEAATREANNNKLWNDSNSNVVVTTTGTDSQEATTTTVLAT